MPERPYLRPGVAGGSKTREREHLVMRLRDMINNCLKIWNNKLSMKSIYSYSFNTIEYEELYGDSRKHNIKVDVNKDILGAEKVYIFRQFSTLLYNL